MAPATARQAGGGYAASIMKEMYGERLPRAATQLLRDHARTRSSSAPAPRLDTVFSTGMAERRARHVVDLKVPRVGQKKACMMPGAGRPPVLPGRRHLSQILLETSNYEHQQDAPAMHGRDCGDLEKHRLQNQYAFGFGSALPTTELSGVAASAFAAAEASASRRVNFASGSLPSSRDVSPHKSGLSQAHERMAVDIVEGVRERQRELEGIDQSLANFVQRSENPGEKPCVRTNIRKEMVASSKRRLELKNAINRDMQDLDKLLDLAPDEDH